MKINFTKKEYRALLDIFEIAEWIMNAHKIGVSSTETVYSALEQKIYSHAKEMGCEDLIHYADNLKKYFPTRTFEETSSFRDIIDEYDEETFGDELIVRLVERDFIDIVGKEKYGNMTLEEKLGKEELISNKYHDEFEKYGIDNLRIVKENKKKL